MALPVLDYMASSNSLYLPTVQFSHLNSRSGDLPHWVALGINADSIWTSSEACELLQKQEVLLFPRSTVSFIITIDDTDLAWSEKNLNKIKWSPEVPCCKMISHLFTKIQKFQNKIVKADYPNDQMKQANIYESTI